MTNNDILKLFELAVQIVQAIAWPLVVFAIFKILVKMGALGMIESILGRTTKMKFPGIELEMKTAVLEAEVKNITADLPSTEKPELPAPSEQITSAISAHQQIEPFSQDARMEYAEKLALRQRAEAMDRMKNFYRQVILDNWNGVQSSIGEVLFSRGIFSPENDHDGRLIIDVLEKKNIAPALLIQLARRLWELKNEAFFSQVPVSQAAATSYHNSAREFSRLISAYKKTNTEAK